MKRYIQGAWQSEALHIAATHSLKCPPLLDHTYGPQLKPIKQLNPERKGYHPSMPHQIR